MNTRTMTFMMALAFALLAAGCTRAPASPSNMNNPVNLTPEVIVSDLSVTAGPTPTPWPTVTPGSTSAPSGTPGPTSAPFLADYSYNQGFFPAGFSIDGSGLIFESAVDNLVPGDEDHYWDTFIYSTTDGAVSLLKPGIPDPAIGEKIRIDSLSADGRTILYGRRFARNATGETLYSYAYLYDIQNRTSEKIDFRPWEVSLGGRVLDAEIAPDARYLLLEVSSTRLELVLIDRTTGSIDVLSSMPADAKPAGGTAHTFSPDGTFAILAAPAADLDPRRRSCDANHVECWGIFTFNLASRRIEHVPARLDPLLEVPDVALTASEGARKVAWVELAEPADPSSRIIRIYDRESGALETICDGEGPDCSAWLPKLSADGKWLAYLRRDSASRYGQVMLRALASGAETRISVTTAGKPAGVLAENEVMVKEEGLFSNLVISGDGRYVAFASLAGNLRPENQGDHVCRYPESRAFFLCTDMYLYDRMSGKLVWIGKTG